MKILTLSEFNTEPLNLTEVQEIKGGLSDCAGEVLAIGGTMAIWAATGPGALATVLWGAYRGHKLYHACFE